jgi:hypothetical protein
MDTIEQPTKLTPADIAEYVLYVTSSKDDVVSEARERGLLQSAHVQEVSKLHKRPSWLSTLPVLVHTPSRTGYVGPNVQMFLSAYKCPGNLRKAVLEANHRKKLWATDSMRADTDAFEPKSAPSHVKRSN